MLKQFVVFDFETTGVKAKEHKITEIGAMRFVDGKVASTFGTFVKSNEVLTDRVKQLTGITEKDLASGLEEKLAFQMLKAFIGNDIIVCHNAGFDMDFLNEAFMRHFNHGFKNHFIDTLTVVRDRRIYPHALGDMCEYYDIWVDEKHRALNDVWLCGKLTLALDKEEPLDKWINKLGYIQKYGPPTWYPEYTELVVSNIKY